MLCVESFIYKQLVHILSTKKGVLQKFCILMKNFCFQSNLDQFWPDCRTHEYCNLTKFGQKTKNLYQNAKFWQDPFLNCVNSRQQENVPLKTNWTLSCHKIMRDDAFGFHSTCFLIIIIIHLKRNYSWYGFGFWHVLIPAKNVCANQTQASR